MEKVYLLMEGENYQGETPLAAFGSREEAEAALLSRVSGNRAWEQEPRHGKYYGVQAPWYLRVEEVPFVRVAFGATP